MKSAGAPLEYFDLTESNTTFSSWFLQIQYALLMQFKFGVSNNVGQQAIRWVQICNTHATVHNRSERTEKEHLQNETENRMTDFVLFCLKQLVRYKINGNNRFTQNLCRANYNDDNYGISENYRFKFLKCTLYKIDALENYIRLFNLDTISHPVLTNLQNLIATLGATIRNKECNKQPHTTVDCTLNCQFDRHNIDNLADEFGAMHIDQCKCEKYGNFKYYDVKVSNTKFRFSNFINDLSFTTNLLRENGACVCSIYVKCNNHVVCGLQETKIRQCEIVRTNIREEDG